MTRILVVDDEFSVRYAVRSVLENAGYDVIEASNGAQALSMLAAYPVEVAVVDIIMPTKEGLETTIHILRDHPSVKVIAISGGGRNRNFDYLEVARSLGAHSILRKPFTDDQLLETITSSIGA